MELTELAGEEQIAFVALLKAVVLADGAVSGEERELVEEIADGFGDDVYRHALAEVDRRFADEDSLKAFLRTVTRPEARDVIYGTVFELALGGAIEGRESALLRWLAEEWAIEVRYESGGEEPHGDGDDDGSS